eukprot:3619500-Karenia_brevis.AAC.1
MPAEGRRTVGHPNKKWDDDLSAFHSAASNGNKIWAQTAQRRELWKALSKHFTEQAQVQAREDFRAFES